MTYHSLNCARSLVNSGAGLFARVIPADGKKDFVCAVEKAFGKRRKAAITRYRSICRLSSEPNRFEWHRELIHLGPVCS